MNLTLENKRLLLKKHRVVQTKSKTFLWGALKNISAPLFYKKNNI